MKKWCMMILAALCLMIPVVGSAQGLPDFLQAVQSGLSEGLASGSAAMEKDLALSVTLSDSRVEEGRDVTLVIRAENPRPAETNVSLTLNLPERLAAQAGEETAWEAALPAAEMDDTGAFVPSVTTFTRTLTLMPGGESEQGAVTAEMKVGSRFYRESLPIALCVADVSAKASVEGAEDGRLTVGETLTYVVEIANAGTAEKTVPVELILPADVTLEGDLPEGFALNQRQIRGEVNAAAATENGASVATLTFPMRIDENALAEDEDAMRLLTGALRVDGRRVALPRVQLCGAKISAKLLPQADSLKAGEEMALRVVLVNSGLAAADVQVSCVLPEGLSLVKAEPEEATADEADPATPDEAGKDQSKQDDATKGEATPGEAGKDQPKQDDATKGEATPDEATPDEAGKDDEPRVSVSIMIDTPEKEAIYEGDIVTFIAVVKADDPSRYSYQWQTSSDGEAWEDVEGENGLTLSVEMTHQNLNDYWRILVAERKGNQQ